MKHHTRDPPKGSSCHLDQGAEVTLDPHVQGKRLIGRSLHPLDETPEDHWVHQTQAAEMKVEAQAGTQVEAQEEAQEEAHPEAQGEAMEEAQTIMSVCPLGLTPANKL